MARRKSDEFQRIGHSVVTHHSPMVIIKRTLSLRE